MDEQGSKSGYKRPPLHTQFKPGRSGNPSGRPKKKGTTLVESRDRELNAKVTVVEGGKRQKITKLEAILKQLVNQAIKGDAKATTLLLRALERRPSDSLDSLPPMLQAMRAIHARHEAAKQQATRTADAPKREDEHWHDDED